uniref:Uncharacterized protein n=1 Tax=Dulem virus 34 TaxID=3145752 RepID=A0AAU8B825_9CAUD
MYGKCLGWGVDQERQERHAAAVERERAERWRAKGVARVIHPAHGSVVVPHSSNYAAILNAAEAWRCDWVEILDAEVWRAEPGEAPVPMPYII